MTPYSVVALVYDAAGRVLAVSRKGKPDDLGLPGGKVEAGETEFSALVREAYEEVGLSCRFVTEVYRGLDRVAHREPRLCVAYHFDPLSSPHARESGVRVAWVPWARLLDERCTYREFNRDLHAYLGVGVEREVT